MSGWDETRRVVLEPPWEAFWVDLYEDPPMGAWLDLYEAAAEALADPRPEQIEKACVAVRPLIAAHNMTDRAGKPLAIDVRSMPAGLFRALVIAVRRELGGSGTSSPLSESPASSPEPSSADSRPPSDTPSGDSPST